MRVVLSADMGRLGRKGDVVEVAGGYARNYLLPRKLAIAASKGTLKQAEIMLRSRADGDRKAKESVEAIAQKIAATPLKIAARAGAEGHLFGSVTTSEIAQQLTELLGIEIDRRKVSVPEAIKSLGSHSFSVSLEHEVTAQGKVEVVSDGTVTPAEEIPEAPSTKQT
ncbi:MAG: 50S ribosomal protein L9 [Actinomycetota bacterium]